MLKPFFLLLLCITAASCASETRYPGAPTPEVLGENIFKCISSGDTVSLKRLLPNQEEYMAFAKKAKIQLTPEFDTPQKLHKGFIAFFMERYHVTLDLMSAQGLAPASLHLEKTMTLNDAVNDAKTQTLGLMVTQNKQAYNIMITGCVKSDLGWKPYGMIVWAGNVDPEAGL